MGANVSLGALCCTWPLAAGASPTSWRPVLKDVELALAIGGDNYTLDYGLESLGLHVGLNHWLIQQACPVILWGASVGPFDRATPYKGRSDSR